VLKRLDSEAVAVYRRLLTYVRPHLKIMLGAILAMVAYAGVEALFPLLMKEVVETLQDRGRAGGPFIPTAIVVLFVARGLLGFVTTYGMGWMGRRVIQELRRDVFNHFLQLPSRFYDQSSSGVLLSKITYNTEQVAESISNVVVVVIRDSFTIIGLVVVMIYLSPPLTLLISIAAPTIALLIHYLSKVFRRYSARIQSSMGDVTRVTEEIIAGQRIVKVFTGEQYERDHFAAANHENFRLNMRLVAAKAIGDALTAFLAAAGIAAVILVAFSETMFQSLSSDVFIAFLTAMAMLMAPLKRLTNVNVALQRGIAGGASLFELLDEEVEKDTGSRRIARARGSVAFEGVSFSYRDDKRSVLRNVDLEVAVGETIAIVGRSGSGKSTLVSLLPRFYDPTAGRILLDDIDIREFSLAELRRQISLVSQEIVLFNDSIANNVAYGGLRGASRERIEQAAQRAHVIEFTRDLPDGLEAMVGERGVLLSGGQRQRIAIARALLKDSPILILDEATSALDTESERHIQTALGELMADRTTLVIAHRLSTVESADRIVVLADGAVVETGNHQELLARGGHYQALYQMQFAD
jgi:subfamily B ATP-binding cassette protein MsbA